jgi:hypothetical protein
MVLWYRVAVAMPYAMTRLETGALKSKPVAKQLERRAAAASLWRARASGTWPEPS